MILALVVTATVSGCTHTTRSTTDNDSSGMQTTAVASRSTTESAGSAITSVTSTAPSLPSASSGAAPVRRCANGSVVFLAASSADATAGPLVFPEVKLVASAAGLSNFYGGGQVPDGPGGSKFYKMGTFVKAGATVTVTVARSARSYLKLQQGSLYHQGEMSVVFQACPGSRYTAWAGGFDIKGPVPACVALDVQVAGEPTLRHLAIPFGAAGCQT